MPPKKSKTKGNQLKAARETKLEREAIAESDAALDNLQSSFRESKAYTTQLEQQLADQVQICTDLQNELNTSHDLINTLCTEISSLKSKITTSIISYVWNDNATSVQPQSMAQWHLKFFS